MAEAAELLRVARAAKKAGGKMAESRELILQTEKRL